MVDYLTENKLFPKGQEYICLSFLSDSDNLTYEEYLSNENMPKKKDSNLKTLAGIRFQGAFSTYEKACEHAKKVQTMDPAFNVYVGEAGKWLPFDPDPNSEQVKDSEYANEELNNLMKGYLENQEKAKLFHEQRKNEKVRENINDNLNRRKQNLNELVNKYSDDSKMEQGTLQTIQEVEKEIKKMESESKELDDKILNLKERIGAFEINKTTSPKPPNIK